ncbi:peptidylprolyl isomerase [Acetivibrio clariflavus]|uniref:peptidylprolyl isomerase n=1 Tax=Acetivibrio clariflavus TaxID=288965 RepID=UPI0004829394|nr:peptidylprolyl isomerase [Acetivibrio clariflavus]
MKLKRILTLAIGLSLAFSMSACNNKQKVPSTENSYEYVGMVGDEKIYTWEFKYYLNIEKNAREEEAGIADKSAREKKKFWNAKENGVVRKQEVIDMTLNNLTELKTFILAAKKDNYKLPEQDAEAIARSVEDLIKEKGNGDREKAEKALMEESGVTLEQYQRMYEEYTLAYFNYATSYAYTLEVSEKEMKEEYEKNKAQYGDKVVVKHILVSTNDKETNEPLPEDKVAEKKKLAEEILQKVKAGEDFDALVKQYSDDPGSVDKGGQYVIGRGQTAPEFDEWSFNAKEGDIDIVKTDFGFHIMKFVRKANFEDQKDVIRVAVQRQKFNERMEEIKRQYPLVKNQEALDSLDVFY